MGLEKDLPDRYRYQTLEKLIAGSEHNHYRLRKASHDDYPQIDEGRHSHDGDLQIDGQNFPHGRHAQVYRGRIVRAYDWCRHRLARCS